MARLPGNITKILPDHLRPILLSAAERVRGLTEIRLRAGRPLMIVLLRGDRFVSPLGDPVSDPHKAYIVTPDDCRSTVELLNMGSVYAFQEEFRKGYITLPGGHRVGLAGEITCENGSIRGLKHVTGLNLRLAREVKGAADKLIPHIVDADSHTVRSTLVISSPGCGKTTMLRDIARQLSDGVPDLGVSGFRVAIADERSEIAGSFEGVPQNEVGARTDVLDRIPKTRAIPMMLRGLSPEVLVTDEIGDPEDAAALFDACNSGVSVIASAHASTVGEVFNRRTTCEAVRAGGFQIAVELSRRCGPGTIEAIVPLDSYAEIRRKQRGFRDARVIYPAGS